MKTRIIFLLLILFTLPALANTPGEVMEGEFLRDATLYGFGGDVQKLSALRGKPLIINMWASWCPPCRAEMSSLDQLYQRYGGKQFNLIGISADDDSNAAFNFLMQSGITFANYADHKLIMENMLGAHTIPLTLLIDANGKVLKKFHGFHEWDSEETIAMIAKLFETKLQ